MNISTRKYEIIGWLGKKFDNLPVHEKQQLVYWEDDTKKPVWWILYRNLTHPEYSYSNQQRLLVPMPESDPVVSLLWYMKTRIEELIPQERKDNSSPFYIKMEIRARIDFILFLELLIQSRKTQDWIAFTTWANFKWEYWQPFKDFKDIRALYLSLYKLSKKSIEEKDRFILDIIPWHGFNMEKGRLLTCPKKWIEK